MRRTRYLKVINLIFHKSAQELGSGETEERGGHWEGNRKEKKNARVAAALCRGSTVIAPVFSNKGSYEPTRGYITKQWLSVLQ